METDVKGKRVGYYFVKRLFDILASGLALIVLLPLWLVAIIGIEVSDPGPVFYMANRIGKDNKPFKMFKFRSMRVDKNANEKNFKADTKRIFGFGQFMRDTKLDELPQLINVFFGDMTIIGPRPASSDQVEMVRAGKYAAVSSLKPGLSGPSALYDYIYGDKIQDEEEYERLVLKTRLDLDIYYTRVMSVGYDLKMICQTVVCILYLIRHKTPEKLLHALQEAAKTVE